MSRQDVRLCLLAVLASEGEDSHRSGPTAGATVKRNVAEGARTHIDGTAHTLAILNVGIVTVSTMPVEKVSLEEN